jgi:hypothetical protein
MSVRLCSLFAVTDRAFGWGFRARLDSLDGLTIVP